MAQMGQVNIGKADLTGADLLLTDLTTVIGLTWPQLRNAVHFNLANVAATVRAEAEADS